VKQDGVGKRTHLNPPVLTREQGNVGVFKRDKMKNIVISILMIQILVGSIYAGPGNTSLDEREEIVRARLIFPTEELSKQSSSSVLLEIDVLEDWHINSDKPLEEFLIPTKISFKESNGITFGRIQYMEPELRKFSFSNTKMSVYEGKVYVLTVITISPDFKGSEIKLRGSIYYQACNDESCLAPTEYSFAGLLPVVDAENKVSEINKEIFDRILPQFQAEERKNDSEFSQIIKKSGFFYTFLFIFLGGLALNLTPCVYPLIPITISYFGGQSEGNKKSLVLRAVIYVLGMAITYSVLGVLASLTGSLLGSALQNPLVLIFIALVLIALAMSMFGLYEIRVPQSLAMLGSKNRAGYIGTLFMGLTVGLIAAPCIGPFVLGLLTYVSELGDPILGFWMFFVLALGLGTPFLILGIFSGAATHLPRSGAWMIWVRNIFGFVLIGMAIYFLEPLFPEKTYYYYSLAIVAIIAGIYLGWLDKNTGNKAFKITRNLVGVSFILLGVFFMLPSDTEAGENIKWQTYSPQLLQQAKDDSKPVILDFYADWCIPCKELDKFTFSDQRVMNQSENFIMLKADLTHFQSDQTNALRTKFNIRGVPTIVFINKEGIELNDLRLIGFEEADQFLERMVKTQL
jgi:thiol:disulfide interchange protein DsbD